MIINIDFISIEVIIKNMHFIVIIVIIAIIVNTMVNYFIQFILNKDFESSSFINIIMKF